MEKFHFFSLIVPKYVDGVSNWVVKQLFLPFPCLQNYASSLSLDIAWQGREEKFWLKEGPFFIKLFLRPSTLRLLVEIWNFMEISKNGVIGPQKADQIRNHGLILRKKLLLAKHCVHAEVEFKRPKFESPARGYPGNPDKVPRAYTLKLRL